MNRSRMLQGLISTRIWSPFELFSNNEQGAWYDPYDLDTMFQDTAGTIPVTSNNDPVKLWLDKSGNGYHVDDGDGAVFGGTFKTDGTYNWVEFSSSGDDRLLGGQLGFASGTDPSHLFVAGQFLSAPNANDGFLVINRLPESTRQRGVGFENDTQAKVDMRVGSVIVPVDSSQNKHIYEGYFSGNIVRGTVDGDSENQQSRSFDTNNSQFQIGKGLTTNSRQHKNFGVIMVGYELTNNQRTKINQWLAEKSGITL